MRAQRQNHCYAPGCKTGYVFKKDAPKIALFSVPKDPSKRREWERNLRRSDKPLDDTSAVCELHFEPHFVLRDYVHFIQGQEVRLPRGKPALNTNAVPTLLPNLPEYLSKKVPKRRPPRKRRRSDGIQTAPKEKKSCGDLSGGPSSLHDHVTDAHQTPERNSEIHASAALEERPEEPPEDQLSPGTSTREDDFIGNLSMPSEFWAKHVLPG